MKLSVYTDGASRGNPGPASYGFVILDAGNKLIHEEGKYIGETTNNVAEYTAVLKAFEWLRKKYSGKKDLQIDFFADSKLVAEQLSGNFKIKAAHLKPIIEKIKVLSYELGYIVYAHIPREKNKRADFLANSAFD